MDRQRIFAFAWRDHFRCMKYPILFPTSYEYPNSFFQQQFKQKIAAIEWRYGEISMIVSNGQLDWFVKLFLIPKFKNLLGMGVKGWLKRLVPICDSIVIFDSYTAPTDTRLMPIRKFHEKRQCFVKSHFLLTRPHTVRWRYLIRNRKSHPIAEIRAIRRFWDIGIIGKLISSHIFLFYYKISKSNPNPC